MRRSSLEHGNKKSASLLASGLLAVWSLDPAIISVATRSGLHLSHRSPNARATATPASRCVSSVEDNEVDAAPVENPCISYRKNHPSASASSASLLFRGEVTALVAGGRLDSSHLGASLAGDDLKSCGSQ